MRIAPYSKGGGNGDFEGHQTSPASSSNRAPVWEPALRILALDRCGERPRTEGVLAMAASGYFCQNSRADVPVPKGQSQGNRKRSV